MRPMSPMDAVVVCGDLCIDGPDSGAEMGFAALARDGLEPHVLDAIKGHGRWRFLREMPACPPVLTPPA